MRYKVTVGSLNCEYGSFSRGDTIELTPEEAKRFGNDLVALRQVAVDPPQVTTVNVDAPIQSRSVEVAKVVSKPLGETTQKSRRKKRAEA